MNEPSNGLQSTAQVLTLTRGLYLVSVTSATPRKLGDDAELILPAIHVGPGPGVSSQQIELMTGPRNTGHWLCEARDTVIVKVSKGPAHLLLTSLRTEDMPNMEVEVRRLDARREDSPALQVRPPAAPVLDGSSHPAFLTPAARNGEGVAVRSRIDLHLQNRGDVSFTDSFWAGELGERLAIEAFSIHALERVETDQFEYRASMENGLETDWVAGGDSCGSRGQGVALTGFAVRLKARGAGDLDCEYRGAFSSGKIVGPVRNGASCHGEEGDRLEAIQVLMVERQAEDEHPTAPRALIGADVAHAAAEAPRLGPRFSVFRDAAAG
jgi:hypothetical protein